MIPASRLNPVGLGDRQQLSAAHQRAGLLRRERSERSRQPALPRRAIHRQARRRLHHLVARQRQLPALLLAGAWQHRVSDRLEPRPMASAAPRGFHAVQQSVHRQPHHRGHGSLRLQPLPELQLRRQPGLQPRQPGLQPELREPGSEVAVAVPVRHDEQPLHAGRRRQQLVLRARLEQLLGQRLEVSWAGTA